MAQRNEESAMHVNDQTRPPLSRCSKITNNIYLTTKQARNCMSYVGGSLQILKNLITYVGVETSTRKTLGDCCLSVNYPIHRLLYVSEHRNVEKARNWQRSGSIGAHTRWGSRFPWTYGQPWLAVTKKRYRNGDRSWECRRAIYQGLNCPVVAGMSYQRGPPHPA